MADRTDIDALLIGALYGELTPADEARLAAHLESHPADRTALTDLTRTRDAVRESRIRIEQADPPQAISALLLQEASRRAPRPPARDPESASWFQRLFRSTIVAHPAMAAAATLVLVIGAAGTLYLHGSVPIAASEQTSAVAPTAAPPAAATPAIEQAAAAPNAALPAAAPPGASQPANAGPAGPEGAAAAGSTTGAGSAAGTGAYRVDVAPLGESQPGAARPATAGPSDLPAKAETVAEARRERAIQPSELADSAPAPASAGAAPARPRGIELRSPEPQPKELPYRRDGKAPQPKEIPYGRDGTAPQRESSGKAAPLAPPSSRAAAASSPSAMDDDANLDRGRDVDQELRAADRTAGAASPAPRPPPPAAAAPGAVAVPTKPAAGKAKTAPAAANAVSSAGELVPDTSSLRDAAEPAPSTRPLDGGKFAKRAPARADNVPPRAPPPGGSANAASAAQDRRASTVSSGLPNDKAAVDPAVLNWARKQRDRVVALVAANDCRGAAAAAVEISRRAPDYYAASVATDRAIRPCLVYINSERQRDDRNRAVKNNTASEPPAQAAPPARQ